MGIIGVANPLNKGIYRNMPCPCGSGKKSKKCHGLNLVIQKDEYDHIMNMGETREKKFTEALSEQLEKRDLKIDAGKDETETA